MRCALCSFTCQTIQKDFPDRDFLIMVMTANAERSEREWVRDIDAVEFLEKPLSPRKLVARLEDYFQGRSTQGKTPYA